MGNSTDSSMTLENFKEAATSSSTEKKLEAIKALTADIAAKHPIILNRLMIDVSWQKFISTHLIEYSAKPKFLVDILKLISSACMLLITLVDNCTIFVKYCFVDQEGEHILSNGLTHKDINIISLTLETVHKISLFQDGPNYIGKGIVNSEIR